jgi:outer membrane lipoprotein carrier protein
MFLSSLSLISPSLWFISSLGLAQMNINANPEPSPQKATVNTAVKQKPVSKNKVKPRLKRTLAAKANLTAALKKPTAKTPPCENAQGVIKDAICVVQKLQAIYQNASSMTATFKQAYTYSVYQRTQVSTGELFLKKPGRMRWDYKTPQNKVFVSNGDDLWVYEPEKNQAYKKSLKNSELPVAISFLMGKGNLLNEFTPTIASANKEKITVVLNPLNNSRSYKELRLVVNRTSFMVEQTTILDPANNTNTVTFSNLVINPDLPASGFEFTPPKGVNIL